MSSRKLIVAAYLFDWIAGDPEWFPHPVRLMGRCIEIGERGLRRENQDPIAELVSGGVLTAEVVAGFYFAAAKIIRLSYKQSPWLGIFVETGLGWTCLASRSLNDEVTAVIDSLDANDLVRARKRLARIVGRDTEHLDEREICRAVIETIAESASDGVIAPLFYMAIGGVPLAMAYKAVNTLDSMIGHADEKYFYFGKAAARLDDLANFLPSRLTALAITAASAVTKDANPHAAFETWMSDGNKHKSPNAGQPESAMAGALQVKLGGRNFYKGELIETPFMGENFSSPSIKHAKTAIRIVSVVSALGVTAALLFRRNRR